MSEYKTIYGVFDDEEILLSSVKEIRSQEIDIKEVYTPFPIHGLDKALGLKETIEFLLKRFKQMGNN